MKRTLPFLTTCVALLALTGCGTSSSDSDPVDPAFTAATFSTPTVIDNLYSPLTPATTRTYQAVTEDGVETIVVEVLSTTRDVAGVTCVVVHDQVYLDEVLVEDTYDWFAQDDAGNVWYLGEDVVNYEYDDAGDLLDTNSDGAWEAGVDGAVAGILIKATPLVGDSYRQEYYAGKAEDMAKVVALNVTVTLADGTVHTGCVQTQEWSALASGPKEYKYYAASVGLVKEEPVGGSEVVELKGIFLTEADEVPDFAAASFTAPTTIDNEYLPLTPGTTHTYQAVTEDGVETIVTEVLGTTRVVAGVESVVFRDRVYLDEVLIEDTYDWFAQDDAGNVWYLGEDVVNYEYDDAGDLLGTNTDGAWEAGIDGALPGVTMWAAPVARTSYYQEYWEDEATDMGYVVALGVEVELDDGSIYADCVQILDWNPLAPETLEYKYFAPGVGLVKEEVVGGDQVAELKGIFLTNSDQVPAFAAAAFSAPTVIDNTYSPLTPGTTQTYQAVTEDGVETIVVEVLSTTRDVAGVTCVVARDRKYLDDVLVEDTHDWFAQDDAGNVWYLGEEVDNYEYDDAGNLLGINHDGAWEAGVDGALPGVTMWASPAAGTSYYQEYWEDEATDMGYVVSLGVAVTLEDGTAYPDCVQTLDWTPLDPAVLEYKYYAPGVGLVKEELVGVDEGVELIGIE